MFSIDMNININIHDVYDIFIRQCVWVVNLLIT